MAAVGFLNIRKNSVSMICPQFGDNARFIGIRHFGREPRGFIPFAIKDIEFTVRITLSVPIAITIASEWLLMIPVRDFDLTGYSRNLCSHDLFLFKLLVPGAFHPVGLSGFTLLGR